MSKKKETAPEEAATQQAKNGEDSTVEDTVVPMENNPVKYDVEQLRTWFDTVFHTVAHGASTLAQLSPKAPRGFGVHHDQILTPRLAKTDRALKGYVSTATFTPIDGSVRNKREAFKHFHVLVLDDIGTKIPKDKIPEELDPTYVIESSEGNFQYGYVLEEPIDNYDEAMALLDYSVDAGLNDAGGQNPVRKVRMPAGVNGKKGPKGAFHVKLHDMDGPLWTPQALCDAMGLSVDWEVAREKAAERQRRSRHAHIRYNPDELFYYDLREGYIDPVVEWMQKQGWIIQEGSGAYIDILCPWHLDHTDEDLQAKIAGYSPLGHGDRPFTRAFHCFHSHWKGKSTKDFLQKVYEMGGPLVPVMEVYPQQVMKYLFLEEQDKVIDTSMTGVSLSTITAVGRITQDIFLPNAKAPVKALPLWLKQSGSISCKNLFYDGTTRERIVKYQGEQYYNAYFPVQWDEVRPDMAKVQPFLDHFERVFPNETERAYVLDWFTAKVQDPSYRGPAIVNITSTEGTGRGILAQLIAKLFSESNCENVGMSTLLGHGNSDFNEWHANLFVFVEETLADADARRAYNRLKDVIDPTSKVVTINPKKERKYPARVASSFMLFSNHEDAVYTTEATRRFYVTRGNPNAMSVADIHVALDYLQSNDWMEHVWWYFLNLPKVDPRKLSAPQAPTETMKEMIDASRSPMEWVMDAYIETWPTDLIPFMPLRDLLIKYEPRGVTPEARKVAHRLFNDRTSALHAEQFDNRVKVNKMQWRCRIRRGSPMLNSHDVRAKVKAETAKYLEKYDEHKLAEQVDTLLSEWGCEF